MFIVIEGDNGTGKDSVGGMFVKDGFYSPTYENDAIALSSAARKLERPECTLAFLEYCAFCGRLAQNHEKSIVIRYWLSTLSAAYADCVFNIDITLAKARELYSSLPVPNYVFFLECNFDERIRRINARQIDSDDDRTVERAQKYAHVSRELSKIFQNWYIIDTTNTSPESEYAYMRQIINAKAAEVL
jgi:thymidylate kinase